MQEYIDTVARLIERYHLLTSDVIIRYYRDDDPDVHEEYITTINSSGIEAEMDALVRTIVMECADKPPLDESRLSAIKALDEFGRITIPTVISRIDVEKCIKCGERQLARMDQSEMICVPCRCVQPHYTGLVLEPASNVPENRTKMKNEDVSRHFREWMARIQAIDRSTIPQAELDKIRQHAIRHNISPAFLTIGEMRRILIDLELTKRNDNAAYLMTQLGVRPPPRLTHADNARIEKLFRKVMAAFDELYKGKRYYPDIIYRVIDYLYPRGEQRRLLDFIHLQSRDTLIKNDRIHKHICEHLGPDIITYKPLA